MNKKKFITGGSSGIGLELVNLLSDAGAWITGQVVPIDGGMSSLRTYR
jgi:NAD(P)-dependent dehydrogenase (short-subunit alcohol dehydrogenase family)